MGSVFEEMIHMSSANVARRVGQKIGSVYKIKDWGQVIALRDTLK